MTTLAPPATLRAYVVHRRDMDGRVTTVPVEATSISNAQNVSPRLGSAVRVHDTTVTNCGDCRRARATEAVTRG